MTASEQMLSFGKYDLRGMPQDWSWYYRRMTTSAPISDTMEGRRYTRRNRLKVPGERGGRHLSETPVGKQVIAEFTKPLVERLTGLDLDPPGGLADTLAALPPRIWPRRFSSRYCMGCSPPGAIRESPRRRSPAPRGRS